MDAHQQALEADELPHALQRGLPESQAPPEPPGSGVTAEAADASLEELRALLARPDRQRSATLAARVETLEHRTSDPSELVAAISPLMGDIIRRKIQDSRDEMIEALYPIIGQLIGRAVAEAIRDLARTIDTRMRTSFSLGSVLRRWRGRVAGVPDAALALRDALPFRVAELFLVHRESGLLLQHLSNEPETADQADLVSGMLTAIRDFAHDAFGRGQEGQLDEIQYGTKRILVEASQHAYLAVVVDGIEPAGFRQALRERIIAVENAYAGALAHYDGNADPFAAVRPDLRPLLVSSTLSEPASQAGLSVGQRRIVVGMAALLVVCLLAACVGSALALRSALNRPAMTVVVVITATSGPTAVPTATATATPTPTATATPSPSPTASPTVTPTATAMPTIRPTPGPSPVARVLQQANIRSGPGLEYEVLEIAASGREFVVVGRNAPAGWWQVCCTQSGASGWVASALVQLAGSMADVPVTAGEQ